MGIKEIVIISFIITGMLFIGFILLNLIQEEGERTSKIYECLDPIAENYCEQNDMVYLNKKTFTTYFYCIEDERASKREKFLFLKNETKNCKLFAKGEQE